VQAGVPGGIESDSLSCDDCEENVSVYCDEYCSFVAAIISCDGDNVDCGSESEWKYSDFRKAFSSENMNCSAFRALCKSASDEHSFRTKAPLALESTKVKRSLSAFTTPFEEAAVSSNASRLVAEIRDQAMVEYNTSRSLLQVKQTRDVPLAALEAMTQRLLLAFLSFLRLREPGNLTALIKAEQPSSPVTTVLEQSALAAIGEPSLALSSSTQWWKWSSCKGSSKIEE
jgi:hypothetical protein